MTVIPVITAPARQTEAVRQCSNAATMKMRTQKSWGILLASSDCSRWSPVAILTSVLSRSLRKLQDSSPDKQQRQLHSEHSHLIYATFINAFERARTTPPPPPQ